MSPCKRRSDRGFTLIELLTAIAVIAILALFLMPVFDFVRARQNQMQCASNMRQIALAMLSYATSNGGYLPPATDSAATDADGRTWDSKLRPFLGVEVLPNGRAASLASVLYSPSDPRPLVVNSEMRRWSRSYAIPSAGNIGVWEDGIGITAAGSLSRNMSEFTTPERTVMLVQYYDENNYQFGAAFTVMHAWSVAAGKGNAGKINGRYFHGDSNNFAFADGHVEALPPTEINTQEFNRFRVSQR